jgi:hypothetical protein
MRSFIFSQILSLMKIKLYFKTLIFKTRISSAIRTISFPDIINIKGINSSFNLSKCSPSHSLHSKGVVRSTRRHTIHLQFDISANGLEIRAVQTPKYTF